MVSIWKVVEKCFDALLDWLVRTHAFLFVMSICGFTDAVCWKHLCPFGVGIVMV
jgi:hypothetical protein